MSVRLDYDVMTRRAGMAEIYVRLDMLGRLREHSYAFSTKLHQIGPPFSYTYETHLRFLQMMLLRLRPVRSPRRRDGLARVLRLNFIR